MEQLALLDERSETTERVATVAWHLDDAAKATARRGLAACRAALAASAARQALRAAA